MLSIKTCEEAKKILVDLRTWMGQRPFPGTTFEQNIFILLEFLLKQSKEYDKEISEVIEDTWPQKGDEVWYYTGKVEKIEWSGADWEVKLLEQGRIERTEKRAVASLNLERHIAKIKMPQNGEYFLFADIAAESLKFYKSFFHFGKEEFYFSLYKAGLILPITASEEDKLTRIGLLNEYGEAFL